MSDCATGCTIRREHHTGCDQATCGGCAPRPAEYGTLCLSCHGRLARDLTQAPALVAYLRGMLIPGRAPDQARISGTREQPSVLNLGAVDGADAIHAQLCSWVLLVLEEHPGNLHGPPLTGSWMTRTEQPIVAGLKPDAGSTPTTTVTRWLLAHQEWIEGREWAHVMVTELGGTVGTLRARFPDHEGVTPIRDTRCPECDRLSLSYHPPGHYLARMVVQCDHHDCGAIIPETSWGLFARILGEERAG